MDVEGDGRKMSEIINRLKSIQKLPACPKIIPQAIKLSQNPETPISAYEKLIAQDPALVAEVLRSVNSPFYGLRNKVSSLRLALSIIGLQEIFRIILNASFHKTFKKTFQKLSYNFDTFWAHSQYTANAAYILAKSFQPEAASEAYIAGLLHDIGLPILEEFFCEEWSDILFLCEEGMEFHQAEVNVMGLSHSDLASLLLEHWKIPEAITIPVRYHHHPQKCKKYKEIVTMVYFADRLAINLMNSSQENVTQEQFEKDDLWFEMLERYPRYRVLENEDFINQIQPYITRKIAVGV
ncbi:MAG: HDOD domain-containing protein [Calditrichaeota bacterium]|nr:MAG: HDOD domain-containing protein [Calditrichota bacterium]